MGAITLSYRASSNLTVTNLASLAASASFVAGWTSGTIDNTSNLDDDILVSGKLLMANSVAAGSIRIYGYTMLDDSNWGDLFSAGTEGTEGTATVHTSTIRDAGMVLLKSFANRADPGTDDTYTFGKVSVRGAFGFMPSKFALFITSSVALAASGQQVTIQGVGASVA